MNLEELRQKVDQVDEEMLRLFAQRMELSREIGAYKMEQGLNILDSSREKEVLKDRLSQVEDKELRPAAQQLVSLLMDLSKQEQKKLLPKEVCEISPFEVVAYQGVEGAYSEQALEEFFGEDACRVCLPSFENVFEAITDGRVKYGIVPIENSSTGAVADIYDLLMKYNCFIVGEQLLEVHHCLAGVEGATLDDVEVVFSHPQGLMQCSAFIRDMGFDQKEESNTAASARKVAALGEKKYAAIASRRAAEANGLTVLAENISPAANTTRFIVIAAVAQTDEESDKISTSFTLQHECGTLNAAISCFAEQGLNLLKIESRPTKKNWEYRFFADFEGNLEDESVQKAIVRIIPNCVDFRILGNYKRGV